jgi:peptide/nickel transport system permease protein
MSDIALPQAEPRLPLRRLRFLVWTFRGSPSALLGLALVAAFLLLAAIGPWLVPDPADATGAMHLAQRLQPPSALHWFGTDNLGRDVFARTVFGARVSLLIGITVAVGAIAGGMVIGLLCGFYRRVDAVLMRLMDGLMAIPAILLAIALVSLWQGGVPVVILAILVPELPRDVRLVRSIVVGVRERPFVEAAIAGGARTGKILRRHILPSTIAPLTVQGTYVCASAILVEAGLSFLGAGIPPNIPTWGNMIAGSQLYLAIAPWTIFCPGIALAVLVLAVNMLGDGLRDWLDPRLSRQP